MQEFNFHTHTQRCNHAERVEDEVFVEHFIKAGFKRIAFTDHCAYKRFNKPNPGYDTLNHLSCEQVPEYLSSIKTLKEKYKNQINIYSGFEAEYVPDFIDEIKQMYDESDILVLGQHNTKGKGDYNCFLYENHEDKDIENYAELIEEGLSTGLFKVLAHPDLFKFDEDPLTQCQIKVSERILKAAEKYKIPIELNLGQIYKIVLPSSSRIFSYPCKEFWEMATHYDVDVIWGIDAHWLCQIDNYEQIQKFAVERVGKEIISKLHFIDSLPFEKRSDR